MSILNEDDLNAQLNIFSLLGDNRIAINIDGFDKDLLGQLNVVLRNKLEEKGLDVSLCVDKIYEGKKPVICIYTNTDLLQRNDALIANSANHLCFLNITSFDDEKQDSSQLMQFLGLKPIKLGIKKLIDTFPKDKEYYSKLLLELIGQLIVGIIIEAITK